MHDWSRVPAGDFHDFHQSWSVAIRSSFNQGGLPEGYYAQVEQKVSGPEPDVIALQTRPRTPHAQGGTATLAIPSTQAIFSLPTNANRYARKANRIVVRHAHGKVVAIIEIVSPGNKSSRDAFESLLSKTIRFLEAGVHVLLVDPFRPTPRDPHGVHAALWDRLGGPSTDHIEPEGPISLVSYCAGDPLVAYAEARNYGEPLPDIALFLDADLHVPVPLEATYTATWAGTAEPVRELLAAVNTLRE